MAKNKTTETTVSVTGFLQAVPDETRRKDGLQLMDIMEQLTGFKPKMWGPSIVGFGSYHYKYDSGHEGDAPLAAFSPRKEALVLYLSTQYDEKQVLLQQLGKHKTGKGCLYIKKLSDVDIPVLKKMILQSVDYIKKLYPAK